VMIIKKTPPPFVFDGGGGDFLMVND